MHFINGWESPEKHRMTPKVVQSIKSKWFSSIHPFIHYKAHCGSKRMIRMHFWVNALKENERQKSPKHDQLTDKITNNKCPLYVKNNTPFVRVCVWDIKLIKPINFNGLTRSIKWRKSDSIWLKADSLQWTRQIKIYESKIKTIISWAFREWSIEWDWMKQNENKQFVWKTR